MSESAEPSAGPSGAGPIDLETAIRRQVLPDDARYAVSAYLFIYEGLAFTQKRLSRDAPSLGAEARHVTGQELVEGIRAYALEMFGPLAPTVFRSWGVERTQDFGEIVFNLVEHDLLGKTDTDQRRDFENGFDFDTAFDGPVRVKPE